MTTCDDAAAAGEVVIQVVRGQPDPAELAAVTLVLLAAVWDRERGSQPAEPRSQTAARAMSWPAAAARYCPPCSWQAGPAARR